MPKSLWNVELPTFNDLPAPPKGVVVHWTGGSNRANAVDLAAYHYVVEGDGTVVRGKWSVAANMRRLSVGDHYAAHTGGWNSFRVGISAAGMKGYVSRSSTGSFPLKERQVERLMEVAGYFVQMAGLDPMNPLHLCSHQEVWTIHRIKGTRNHQKTDIEYLPFRPDLKPAEVGNYLRKLAAKWIRESTSDLLPVPEISPIMVVPVSGL